MRFGLGYQREEIDSRMTPISKFRERNMALTNAVGIRIILAPVSILSGIYGARIALEKLSPSLFALSFLISGFLAIFGFLDLGLSAGMMNLSAQSALNMSGDHFVYWKRARNIIIGVGVALLIVVLLTWKLHLLQKLLHIPDMASAFALPAILVGIVLSIAVKILGLSYLSLSAHGKSTLALLLQGSASIISFLVILLACHIPNIQTSAFLIALALLIGQLVMASVGASVLIFTTRRRDPIGIDHQMKETSRPMALIMVLSPAAVQSERILLIHLANTFTLAQYAAIQQVLSPIISSLAAVRTVLWAKYAKFRADESIRTLNMKAEIALYGAAGAACVVVAKVAMVLIIPIIDPHGKLQPISSLLIDMACITAGLMVAHLPISTYLTDISGLRFQAKQSTMLILTSVTVSILTAPVLHSAAVPFGSTIGWIAAMLIPGYLRILRGTPRADLSSI